MHNNICYFLHKLIESKQVKGREIDSPATQSVADFIGTAVAGIIGCLFCILKLWTQISHGNRNSVASTFWCIGMNVLWHSRAPFWAHKACWLYTDCHSCIWHCELWMLVHAHFQSDRKILNKWNKVVFFFFFYKNRQQKMLLRQDSWRSKHPSFRNTL